MPCHLKPSPGLQYEDRRAGFVFYNPAWVPMRDQVSPCWRIHRSVHLPMWIVRKGAEVQKLTGAYCRALGSCIHTNSPPARTNCTYEDLPN